MRCVARLGLVLSFGLLAACAPPRAAEVPRAEPPPGGEPSLAATHDVRPTEALAEAGRVTLTAFAMAGRVTWQGLWTAGHTLRGLVTGGPGITQKSWEAGAERTRSTAREGAELVRAAARPAS